MCAVYAHGRVAGATRPIYDQTGVYDNMGTRVDRRTDLVCMDVDQADGCGVCSERGWSRRGQIGFTCHERMADRI